MKESASKTKPSYKEKRKENGKNLALQFKLKNVFNMSNLHQTLRFCLNIFMAKIIFFQEITSLSSKVP